ncbi:MAG: ferritin family protein [Candidatus Aminicenantaceae bacterium]
MNLKLKLSPSEVLAVAIRSEIQAAETYSKISREVENEILRMKLKFLISEEEKHHKMLERLFSQRFPKEKLEIPDKSFLPPVKVTLGKEFSVLELFKFALNAERMSEEYYKEAGKREEDKESKRILGYLARVERSHYFIVESEIDMLNKFPDYYKVEDFHLGQDMFHVGP